MSRLALTKVLDLAICEIAGFIATFDIGEEGLLSLASHNII